MSDDRHVVPDVRGLDPASSLEVAQAVLRAGDGSVPAMLGVGRSRPAFLLPASTRVAARICRSYNGLRPRRRRWERSGVALGLRLGAGAVLGAAPLDHGVTLEGMPDSGSLLADLGDVLGTPVLAGVGLGTLDAYWKPVLQLFDASGDPVGFAKVGWTPMTRRLVENEWSVLTHLDRTLRSPVVPRPLARIERGPLVVVVTAPLPPDSRRLGDDVTAPVPGSMSGLAGDDTARLPELAWWRECTSAVDDALLPELAPVLDVPDLPGLLARVQALHDAAVPVGLLHGDWVPWNQARSRARGDLVVWDWEYADLRAPLGLDEVHGRYQTERLVRGRSDGDAFGLAHDSIEPARAALHGVLVASRRCRAVALGARDHATVHELRAAAAAVRAALARAGEDRR